MDDDFDAESLAASLSTHLYGQDPTTVTTLNLIYAGLRTDEVIAIASLLQVKPCVNTHARTLARMCTRVRMHVGSCTHARAQLCACLLACVRACVPSCVNVYGTARCTNVRTCPASLCVR
jgi:hypothetical protein